MYFVLIGHYCLLLSLFQLEKIPIYLLGVTILVMLLKKDLCAQQHCLETSFWANLERVSFSRFRQLHRFLSLCNCVFFQNIVNYCMSLPKANSTSILLFLTAVVVLRINKCIKISFNHYPIDFPMEVFLVGVLIPQIHGSDYLKYLWRGR